MSLSNRKKKKKEREKKTKWQVERKSLLIKRCIICTFTMLINHGREKSVRFITSNKVAIKIVYIVVFRLNERCRISAIK